MMTVCEALERTKRAKILDAFNELSEDELITLSAIEKTIVETADKGKGSFLIASSVITDRIYEYLIKCGYSIIIDTNNYALIKWDIE